MPDDSPSLLKAIEFMTPFAKMYVAGASKAEVVDAENSGQKPLHKTKGERVRAAAKETKMIAKMDDLKNTNLEFSATTASLRTTATEQTVITATTVAKV